MGKVKMTILALAKLETNKGQIEGLPKNPRTIRDKEFDRLKDSIRNHPDLLSFSDLIVYPNGGKFVVICGNQRLAALRDLGYKEVPVTILPVDTPADKLRAIAYKDNVNNGKWNMDALADEWSVLLDLGEYGIDVSQWTIKEQNLDTSTEIDVDDFDEKMSLKLTLHRDEAEWLKEEMKKHSSDPAKAFLNVIDAIEGKEETI